MRNFSFVIEDVLAGLALPNLADLHELTSVGIRALVSLTEMPLPTKAIQAAELSYLHLPVEDFTAPSIEQVKQFVAFVNKTRKDGGATAVHCLGGIGRTGTMLACFLVADGLTAQAAINTVRSLRPGSIETPEQEELIKLFEASP